MGCGKSNINPEALSEAAIAMHEHLRERCPVNSVRELYFRYPAGVEPGAVALVWEENRYYRFHPDRPYGGQWLPADGGDSTDPDDPTDPANPGEVEFSINPVSMLIGYGAITKMVAVVAPDGTWTASTTAGWLSVSKIDNTQASVFVSQNSESVSRTAIVTFVWLDPSGNQYTRALEITQLTQGETDEEFDIQLRITVVEPADEDDLVFEIAPATLSVGYNDTAAKTIAVTAPDNSWAVSSNEDWLTVAKTSGTRASVSLTANTGTDERRGSVIFTWSDSTRSLTQTLRITQLAQTSGSVLIKFRGQVLMNNSPATAVENAQIELYGGNTLLAQAYSGSGGGYSLMYETDEQAWNSAQLRVVGQKAGYDDAGLTISGITWQDAVLQSDEQGIVLPGLYFEPYFDIRLRVRVVEAETENEGGNGEPGVVTEPPVFDISPRELTIAGDDTTPQTISITHSGGVVLGPTSTAPWLSVRMQGESSAEVSATKNETGAQRTGSIVFRYSDGSLNIAVPLDVTQLAQDEAIQTVRLTVNAAEATTLEPVAGATVLIYDGRGENELVRGTTNAAGQFIYYWPVTRARWEAQSGRTVQVWSAGDPMGTAVLLGPPASTMPDYAAAVANGATWPTAYFNEPQDIQLSVRVVEPDESGNTENPGDDPQGPLPITFTANVVDSSGAPVAGAVVAVRYDVFDSRPWFSDTTDASGRFSQTISLTKSTYDSFTGLAFEASLNNVKGKYVIGDFNNSSYPSDAAMPTFAQAAANGVATGNIILAI